MVNDTSSPSDTPAIVVAGAGALGCFVGGMLAASGARVSLLVRPRIAAEIRTHGLTLTDLDGMVVHPGEQALDLTENPRCLARADLILVTVKSRDTEAIGRMIDLHDAGRKAPVVSLQGGTADAASLRRCLPGRDVRAGMVAFGVLPMGQGCYHRTVAGATLIEAGPGDLGRRLSVPGLPVAESRDIEAVLWGALLMNLNDALNALSGLPLRQHLHDRHWRRLMADQWAEALRVIHRAGLRPVTCLPVSAPVMPWVLRLPTPAFSRVVGDMLRIDPQARGAMAHDLMERRPTGIDALQGEIVRMGAALGVPTPINAMVLDVIRAAELAREGLPYLSPGALRAELARLA